MISLFKIENWPYHAHFHRKGREAVGAILLIAPTTGVINQAATYTDGMTGPSNTSTILFGLSLLMSHPDLCLLVEEGRQLELVHVSDLLTVAVQLG